MSLGGVPTIFNLDPYSTSSNVDEGHQFGACGADKYGDLYRWAKAGASNISAGKLQCGPTRKTNHDNMAAAAAVAANTSNKVTVTLGATAAVAQEYAGGYLAASDNSPEGEVYRVVSHPAADASATLEVTIDRLLPTAITTSSEFCLVHNGWNGVVEAAVEEQQPAGVPLIDITATYAGWLKTRGVVAGLAGATIGLGNAVTAHASTAGAFDAAQQFVEATDASRLDDLWILGRAIVAGVSGEYRPIYLQID